nr:MAG TPA: hypothetical protein [Caudoviricetes sp.]
MKKQNKTDNQRKESTIDKYFEKTAKGFDVWVEGNEDDRSYLQIAAECTGDTDEKGQPGYDFNVSYAGKAKFLADGLFQDMKRDEFVRSIVITAARKFLMDK